jgi:hypothetical protein
MIFAVIACVYFVVNLKKKKKNGPPPPVAEKWSKKTKTKQKKCRPFRPHKKSRQSLFHHFLCLVSAVSMKKENKKEKNRNFLMNCWCL